MGPFPVRISLLALLLPRVVCTVTFRHCNQEKDDCIDFPQWPVTLCSDEPQVARPPMWAWPFTQMHLIFQAEKPLVEGKLRVNITSSRVCQLLNVAAGLCADCRGGCLQGLRPHGADPQMSLRFPPYGGCAVIDANSLPENAGRVTATWEANWDPSVPFKIGLGVLLMFWSTWLSQNRMVHAVLGVVLVILIMFLVVLWWLIQEFRRNPLSGSVTAMVFASPVVASLMRLYLSLGSGHGLDSCKDVSGAWDALHCLGNIAQLVYEIEIYGLPVGMIGLGTTVVIFLTTASIGANRSIQCFGSPPDPDGGDVGFEIGADGRRIDHLPPAPLQQRALDWAFWCLGVYIVLTGSQLEAFSLGLLCTLGMQDNVCHFVLQRWNTRSALAPHRLRTLMSARAYEHDGRAHTEMAVNALRGYLREHPELCRRARNPDSELKMRRFSEGDPHCNQPLDSDEEIRRRGCVVL